LELKPQNLKFFNLPVIVYIDAKDELETQLKELNYYGKYDGYRRVESCSKFFCSDSAFIGISIFSNQVGEEFGCERSENGSSAFSSSRLPGVDI
jgi:hypothetical protein